MEKILNTLIEAIIESPQFKEALMLAVTNQLDGLELPADSITGLDDAISSAIDNASYEITVRA